MSLPHKLLVGVFSISLSVVSFAGTITATPKATASITSSCQLSVNDVNFGELNLNSATYSTFANGALNLLCSRGVTYSVLLNCGKVATGAYYTNGHPNTCYMTGASSGANLAYSFQKQPVDHNKTSLSGEALTGTGTGSLQSITMYGEVQYNAFGAPAYPVPDNYSDTMTANVTF